MFQDDRERKVQSRKRKAGESEAKNPMGRPRIEKQYDNLIEAIVDCVNGDAAAQGRRRDEALCSTTTIDQLQSRLSVVHNIDIKRSTLYTRLLPRASATIEGRRHFNCAPIRTCSIQRIKRSEHPDQHFAMASIKHFKGLAELFGPNSIFIFAQDDKARVPIGVPAIQRPVRVTMHVQYKLTLPDHDFVIADRHKLIPSIYGALEVQNGSVTYNGPTYCAIRSGKHDKSTAMSHKTDFEELIKLEVTF